MKVLVSDGRIKEIAMTVPSGSIYLYEFIPKVNGNNAIYYFVKHEQPVVSLMLEETTPSKFGDHIADTWRHGR